MKIIIKLLIGISFIFTRVITSIDHKAVERMIYFMRGGGELNNGVYITETRYGEIIELQIYNYSIFPYIIGVLFIVWALIELKEVKKGANRK